MAQFKISEALKVIYSLIWDDFCSWYLEWVKPGFEQPISASIYNKTIGFFEQLMQLLHPFTPFVTEEIYTLLKEQTDSLCVKQFAQISNPKSEILAEAELLKQVITAIREARNKNQIKPKETIKLAIQTSNQASFTGIASILSKQVNAEAITFTSEAIANSIVVAVEQDKFFLQAEREVDTVALKVELEKDLAYQQNFLQSVLKKLSNERFVQNAKPEVIEFERKKQSDAEARIKTIEESLSSL
jgi:valyl-tRNA synthetase